jgi:DNA-binding response OmpR family regulator
MRVLLVEDEVLVALQVADMIRSLGHEVVGPASTFDRGEALAMTEDFECAVLDINLNGIMSTGIAAKLAERHIPFTFASGYGRQFVPAEFKDRPLLAKPFECEHLQAALDALEISEA